MAVSTGETDGVDMTHTEQIAQEHPEAVQAVADRVGGKAGEYLYSVLEDQQ